jgi:hypothetical protein
MELGKMIWSKIIETSVSSESSSVAGGEKFAMNGEAMATKRRRRHKEGF